MQSDVACLQDRDETGQTGPLDNNGRVSNGLIRGVDLCKMDGYLCTERGKRAYGSQRSGVVGGGVSVDKKKHDG